MSKLQFVLVTLIVLLFLVAPAVAIAQDDATPLPAPTQELFTNTPDVPTAAPTIEPTPIPTPEPEPPVVEGPSRTEVILTIALGIAAILLSVFTVSFVAFSRQLLQAAPPWIQELIKENAGRGLAELDRIVLETPSTLDDELAKQVREIVMKVFEEQAAALRGQ